MRNSNINLSFLDESLNKIAEKYGGWPRLLDPEHATPDEFIDELENAGYTEYSFQSVKSRIGRPERDYWITLIASLVKNMLKSEGTEWHEQMLDEFLPKMREHKITDQEIQAALALSSPDRTPDQF